MKIQGVFLGTLLAMSALVGLVMEIASTSTAYGQFNSDGSCCQSGVEQNNQQSENRSAEQEANSFMSFFGQNFSSTPQGGG